MAQADNKTQATDASVDDFIAAIDHPGRRADAKALLALYGEVTGMEPVLWGPSIIGYGRYHYRYDSGREGDFARAGFSPRKANLSIYFTCGYQDPVMAEKMAALRGKLGKHKMGAACLYVNKLADIDLEVLREMIAVDLAWMDKRYPR
jgi:hypothetical protein